MEVQKNMLLILLLAGIFTYLYNSRKNSSGKENKCFTYYVLFSGIVMRIGYALYTPFMVRSYDIGSANVTEGVGHANYIAWFYLYNTLPEHNDGIFYHPPLYHWLSGMVMRLVHAVTGIRSMERMIEYTKVIPCLSVCGILFLIYDICRLLKLQEKSMLTVLALTAFFPNMYLLGGRVNNDALAVFFMVLIMDATIRLKESANMRNILVLAFSYGLGMMTKLSVGLLAPVTGAVMLYQLFRQQKEKKLAGYLVKLGIFLVVTVPLALWYPIRNLVCFGQPINYVLSRTKQSMLYCGDYSLFQRMGSISLKQLKESLYNHPAEDYNIWIYLLKGGLFGEFTMELPESLAFLSLVIYSVICLLVVTAVVYFIIKIWKKDHSLINYGILLGICGVIMVSYLKFNIQYPFGCTMDIRYIIPVVLCGFLMLGKLYEVVAASGWKYQKQACDLFGMLLVLYAATSVVMYSSL